MSREDLRYLHEEQREIDEGFSKCQCSNCDPEGSITLSQNLHKLTNGNFSEVLKHPDALSRPSIDPFIQKKYCKPRVPPPKELTPALEDFSVGLVKLFEVFFWKKFPTSASLLPRHLFSLDRAHVIAQHVAEIEQPSDILNDLGGAPVDVNLILYMSAS
jgi:hypothetical protein